MRHAAWRNVLAVAAGAGLVAASIWSVLAGAADYRMHQETLKSAQQAIALTPDQSECYARLAWLASPAHPLAARTALRRALALNPWDTRSRIELGLLAEAKGDQAGATRHLLQAAASDHLFLPRWTLMNYYFRRGDTASFWRWAREAASRMYGDPQPVFQLCGRVVEDGDLIHRLKIASPDVQARYLSYLLSQGRTDLLGPSVQSVLRQNRETDTPLLWQVCDRLLEANRVDEAADVWNRLADAGKAGFHAPTGGSAQLIANRDFATSPVSRGFDWRLPVVEGVGFSREEESGGLRITFAGHQPEECEALAQIVAVQGPAAYDLTIAYGTPGLPNAKGLAWRITNATGGGSVLAEGAVTASDTATLERLRLDAPANCRLIRIALTYRRAPGTTRLEGFIVLRNVTLEPVTQPPVTGSRVKK